MVAGEVYIRGNRRGRRREILLDDSRLTRVLVHIERHIHQEIRADELAAIADLSVAHFRARFRRALGEPLARYIRRLRLERAAMFLTFTREPVVDIAFSCGFDSHEGFTRAFHRTYGRAPQAYRASGNGAAARYRERAADLSVRLVERPTWRVAFIRYIGPPIEAAKVWARMLRLARDQGWAKTGAKMISLHYENPSVLTDPTRVRYDAAITVDPAFEGNDQVAVQELPAGIDAVVKFFGKKEDMEDFWHRFAIGWMMPGPYAWRDDRFFDVYETPVDPWLFPEAAEEQARLPFAADLHIPVTRGRLSAEPVPPE